jgi:hydrogenase maturation protease
MQTGLPSLVIGYGNLDRCDDGAGFYVVNRLRRHLSQKALDSDDNGMSGLGACRDSVFIRQLVPELVEIVANYDRVIFVDAHIPSARPPLACMRIDPQQGKMLLSHHMNPEQVLGILKALWNLEPVSYLLSIQGWHFAPGRGLSAGTAKLVAPAAAMILELLDAATDPQLSKVCLVKIRVQMARLRSTPEG